MAYTPGEAVTRAITRHQRHLAAAVTAQAQEPAPPPDPAPPRTGRIASRTRARRADVHQLLAGGLSVRDIAGQPAPSRNTARRFARAASPDELHVRNGTGRQASILDAGPA